MFILFTLLCLLKISPLTKLTSSLVFDSFLLANDFTCDFCNALKIFLQIQKSGVLKKAIDHIKQLRTINHRLSQENTSFKLKLQQLGLY